MASRKEEKAQRREERLAAERESEAAERRNKLYKGLGAAALAAVLVVVVLVAVSQSGDDGAGGGGDSVSGVDEVESELAGIPQRGTVLGERDADVRIVEFGDLQCPACAQYAETQIPSVIDGPVKSGDAQIEFVNFVIIGPDSDVAARAALAASEQDRYWEFVELFYRNQGQENAGYVTDEFLTDIARAAGVEDIEAWNAARDDPRWNEQLAETQSEASTLGIQSTPSVVIKGPGGTESLGAAPSAEEIESAVKAAR